MGWSKKPTDFTLELLKTADKHVQDCTAYALQQTIIRSPVDTGAYRGNNQVSVNKTDNSYDLNSKDPSGAGAYAKAGAQIAKAKIGDVVYVQNCLPYSLRIENGWSQQAPQGVYSLAFQSLANKFK